MGASDVREREDVEVFGLKWCGMKRRKEKVKSKLFYL